MAPVSTNDFVAVIRRSGLIEEAAWDTYIRDHSLPGEPRELARQLVRDGLLTKFQAKHMLSGRHRGLVLGQYRLLDQIGKGGTGVVFLAEHGKLRRRVAIKVLPTDRTDHKEALERFYREARAVAALDHPNIIRAYDVNNEGKIHFLVMEYVDGQSLKDYIESRGALPPHEAAHYIGQAAAGLQHAHERGLIHRDIKPANLLLDKNGTIKILDMGLVLFFEDQDDTLTRDLSRGAVLGTADYLSPEQALDCHEVDIRSDIYSLGATFYTLLNGRPPFHSSKMTQKLIDHQIKEPPPLSEIRPEIPAALSAIVSRMMAKRPEDRFQTPAEVAAALTPWLSPAGPGPEEEKSSPGDETEPAALAATTLPEHTIANVPIPLPPAGRPLVPAFYAGGAVLVLALAAGLWWWLTP